MEEGKARRYDLCGAFRPYRPGGDGIVTEEALARYPQLGVAELGSAFLRAWWYGAAPIAQFGCDGNGAWVSPAEALPAQDRRGRELPLWFRADTGPGCFAVEAVLYAQTACPEALLFVSRRRLVWRGALRAGERVTVRALCDVSPIIAADAVGRGVQDVQSVDVALVGAGVRLQSVTVTAADVPRLCLIGDSTVTDQRATVPYAPGACYAGWGQMLPVYTGLAFCVSNHAHSGLSTETFRTQGHYDNLCRLLRPGDKVLIQFGHNDQKWKHLSASTGYRENLTRYIDQLRALGAEPVLVTPLARNTWKDTDTYNDLLAPYAETVLALGREMGVSTIDLHAWMMEEIRTVGMQAARVWFHPCDYTHLNDFGACRAAGFVAGALRGLGLLPPDTPLPPPWPPHGPMEALEPPEDWQARGLTRPDNEKPLVDYGLIADFPWPVR